MSTAGSEPLALLFPGQGAHDVKMLDGVREHSAFPGRYALVADALGGSPLDAIAAGNVAYLNQNRVTALLTLLVSSISLDLFRERTGRRADFLSGYSVGQWTALYAAGAVSFEQLVAIVAQRSALMDACFADVPGAMLAVIGLKADVLENLCDGLRAESHRVWVSNYNCVGQYTLAGTEEAVTRAEDALAALKPKKVARVPVSGAWHTPLLGAAHAGFAGYLAAVALAPAEVPIVDNVTGAWLPAERPALDRQLARHLDHPVLWEQGMRALLAAGAKRFVEIGYGNVLTKFGFFIDRSVEHQAFYVS
ncbi:MAG: ACP S-malonyltransferase [Deltaproteobacteria bacterium]|nr:ACP S-malonyltransferase [Deltaproteobacteria bacterium]